MWKPVDEMSVEECEVEMVSLEFGFSECAEIGHGISSKDVVRYRACCLKLQMSGRTIVPVL